MKIYIETFMLNNFFWINIDFNFVFNIFKIIFCVLVNNTEWLLDSQHRNRYKKLTRYNNNNNVYNTIDYKYYFIVNDNTHVFCDYIAGWR